MTTLKSQYTPRPWRVECDDEIHYSPEDPRDSSLICETGGNEANARLIAAAPDLLSECYRALEALRNVPFVGDIYDQQHSDTHQRAALSLSDAIAKAEGR